MLLRAQEQYAQILSDATTDNSTSSSSEHSPAQSGDAGDASSADGVSMAFLKGMEDAKKFLPTNSTLLVQGKLEEDGSGDADGRGRRKNRDAEMNRKSKLTVPEPEETGKVVDEMIANGYQLFLQEFESVRISMASSSRAADKKSQKKKKAAAGTGSTTNIGTVVVDLHTLLLHCAQAVAADNRRSAAELLARIRQHSSPWGDATQRLAHCFAEALEARLAGSGSPAYTSIMARRSPVVDFLRAHRMYAAACCFRMMAFKFANMTICKAIDAAAGRRKKKKVHIVDYGIQSGSQWPGLLKFFSIWPGGPPEVRLTGVDLPQPGFRPAARVEETGRRLTAYARRFGVPFTFRGVAAKWESVTAADLDIDPADANDEVLVVNSVVQFGSLMDETGVGVGVGADAGGPSPRDVVLGNVRRMRPDVLVLFVGNGAYSSPYFVPRFREALLHYAAMFDMMDATAPRDSELRVLVERELFGQCALNVVACDGADRVERPETYRQWQARCRRAGLTQLPLHADVMDDVRENVREKYHDHFVTDVDLQWLLGGWKGRILYADSTWAAAPAPDDDDHLSSQCY